jgi:hypothetical protein
VRFFDFATGVLGFRPTPAQRVYMLVAIDDVALRDLDAADSELARLLFGDIDEVPLAARDVIVLVKGARIGGSYLGGVYLLWRALVADVSGLAPGETATSLVVGPDLRLARQALRYARGAVDSVSELAAMVVADTTDSFTLEREDGHRVALEALPATRGGSALRGRSLLAVVLTEAAFFRDEDSGSVNDADVFRAVLPRVLPGGKVLLESTPWLEAGLTYELFRDNHGEPKTALAVHAPTTLMRPDERTLALVEKERARDPDNASREFDAEFLGGGAGVLFDPSSINAAVDDRRPLVSQAPTGAALGWGADLALVSDSSALAGVARVGERYELLELVERRPTKGAPLKLSTVVADFATTLRQHRSASFTADGHVREPAREFADAEKITIEAAPEGREGKWDTYSLVAKLFREGRLRLPRHPRLLAQLRAIVSRPMPGGGYAISSPRRPGGGHGDLVSAFVLAVYAAHEGANAGELTRAVRIARRRGSSYRDLGDIGGGSGSGQGYR